MKLRPLTSCIGKERLPADRAREVAASMRQKGRKVEAYHCGHCSGWHVGFSYRDMRRKPRVTE